MISSSYCADSVIFFRFLFWFELAICERSQSVTFMNTSIKEMKSLCSTIVEESELKQTNIKAVANEAGRNDIPTLPCSGFCCGERERNACPCRSTQIFCTSSCHCGIISRSMCTNCRRVSQDDDNVGLLKNELFFQYWVLIYCLVYTEK